MQINSMHKRLGIIVLVVLLATPVSVLAQSSGKVTLLNSTGPKLDGPTQRMYYTSYSKDESILLDLRKDLIAAGAKNLTAYLPGLIVCDVPLGVDPGSFIKNHYITVAHESQVDHNDRHAPMFSAAWAKRWSLKADELLTSDPRDMKHDPDKAAAPADPGFAGSSVLRVPDEVIARNARRVEAMGQQGEDERLIFQNSEIMSGNILVQLVFPESDGTQENWAQSEMNDAGGAVEIAKTYFLRESRRTDTNFIVRAERQARTTTEPINYPFANSGDSVWVSDVMANLGFDDRPSNYLETVHSYNNYLRELYGVDWVFTAFVVRAVADDDHLFLNSRHASYSYMGGPFMAIPYPAGWPGQVRFSQEFVFSMAAIFWAQEETYTYNLPEATAKERCDKRTGYLNYPNYNLVIERDPIMYTPRACIDYPDQCIANRIHAVDWGYTGPPCRFTEGMLGYTDKSPLDGIPDAFSAPPDIDFGTAQVETLTAQEVHISFNVISQAVRNGNSQQPAALRRDYAVPVKDVYFTIGGVGPISINPIDGDFDELQEEFQTDIPFILPGYSDFVVSARNDYGAQAQESKQVFYLGLDYYGFRFVYTSNGIGLAWNMRGETFDAGFDLHRISHGPDGVDTLLVAWLEAVGSTSEAGMTPYYYLDKTVSPGSEYGYYVYGSFEAEYRGQPTIFSTTSDTFTTVAAFPREGSILSSPSPNPFVPSRHTRIWVSVSVPEAEGIITAPALTSGPRAAAGAAAGAPEPVEVTIKIYDVLGRVVRDLYQDKVYVRVINRPWDGTDQSGRPVPSGMYFLKAKAGAATGAKKVLVIR